MGWEGAESLTDVPVCQGRYASTTDDVGKWKAPQIAVCGFGEEHGRHAIAFSNRCLGKAGKRLEMRERAGGGGIQWDTGGGERGPIFFFSSNLRQVFGWTVCCGG